MNYWTFSVDKHEREEHQGDLAREGPSYFVSLISRSSSRSLQWISEKDTLVLLTREGEINHFELFKSILFSLIRLALTRNHYQSLTCWCYISVQGGGEILKSSWLCLPHVGREIHNSSPLQSICSMRGGKKWRSAGEIDSPGAQNHQKTYNHRTLNASPPSTPYHYITEGLFTIIPFTQYITSIFQQKITRRN